MTIDEPVNLRLDQIRIDGGTQPRVEIDQGVVSEYADLYRRGKDLKPVVVFFDGATYWLADGFHRYWANRKINCNQIFAEVHQGSQRDAILYSVGANADHGLRRSNEDKWKAVKTMLTNPQVSKDEDGNPWSDNAIAKRCHVSSPTVAKVRSTLNIQSAPVRKTSDGRTMNTANIGRNQQPPRRFEPKPGLSPNAMTPIRGHSTHQPKTALELPHDPHWASRAILSAMGHEFARALVKELTAYLEGASE
jgi:hypothetical protein